MSDKPFPPELIDGISAIIKKDSVPEHQLFNDADAVIDSLRKLPGVLVVDSTEVAGHDMIRGILSVPRSKFAMFDVEVTAKAIDLEAMYRREMQLLVALIESIPSINVPDLSDVLPPLPVGRNEPVELHKTAVGTDPDVCIPLPIGWDDWQAGQTVWTVTSVGGNAVPTREVLRGIYKHRQIQRWLAGGKFPKRNRVKVKR